MKRQAKNLGLILAISSSLIVVLTGCASRAPLVESTIKLPTPPERIAIYEPGKPEIPGVRYIDPARIVKPSETVAAPEEGAALLTPRSWRGAKYVMEEWPRWGDAVQSIVRGYNEETQETVKPWWKIW